MVEVTEAIRKMERQAKMLLQAAKLLRGLNTFADNYKPEVKSKRRMSAAARKRIAAAQKKRWAKWTKDKKKAK